MNYLFYQKRRKISENNSIFLGFLEQIQTILVIDPLNIFGTPYRPSPSTKYINVYLIIRTTLNFLAPCTLAPETRVFCSPELTIGL